MKVKERIREGVAVVSVSGKMMGGPEQQECHNRIKELIEDNMPWVVLDMGKVEWLNSSGLGLLMSCLTSCRNAGGDLVVAQAAKKVNSLFMLTQVIKVFDTYETIDEAFEALKDRMG
jgi:anti-sigma B factor antagonist